MTRSAFAEPSPLITKVTSGICRAAATSRSSDWEKPTLPAYITHRFVTDALLAAELGGPRRGPDRGDVDEVRDDVNLAGLSADLERTLPARSSLNTVTAAARR